MSFNLTKKLLSLLSFKERRILIIVVIVLVVASIFRTTIAIQENSIFIPVAGGTYREGIVGQPIFINPILSSNQTDQDISSLVYLRLSDLLESYDIKDSGRVYVLKLKENLWWDDGKPLTSDDILFTLKLVQNPETRSPFFDSWQGVIAERISEIQLQFALPAPYIFFTNNIQRLPIIPKHLFENIPITNLQLSTYKFEPVGNGPYIFKDLVNRKDGFITEYHLTLNKNYKEQKLYIKDFIFKFYKNENDLLEAFQLREIDGFGSLQPITLGNLIPAKTVINKINMPRYYAIFLNSNINTLLKDYNLRYALAEAIDKEQIIQDVFQGNALMINGPFAKLTQKQNLLIPYNPEAAQEKIAEIKTENIELNIIVPQIDFLRKTAAVIQEAWLAIGIQRVNVIEVSTDEIIESVVKSRDYEMLLFGNSLENPLDLFPFWHSSQRFYPGLNLSLYNNQKVDNLIEDIRQQEDESYQSQLKTLESLIVEDIPAIFLYSLPYTYVHHERLRGFQKEIIINPSDRLSNIHNWYINSARVIR